MKNFIFFTTISLFIFACNNKSGETASTSKPAKTITLSPESKTKVEQVLTSYLSLKDAFVKTDFKAAQTQATQLAEITKTLAQDTSLTYFINPIQKSALEISATESIEVQRLAFSAISHAAYDLAKSTSTMQGKLYKQFCPMAFDNKGDFWLSAEKQVTNPYFGDKMLHCGKVLEEL